jgi:hypothetical protein
MPHLLVDHQKYIFSLVLLALGCLVEHASVEGIVDILALGVGQFGRTAHLQKHYFDGRKENNEVFVDEVVCVVVEEEVDEKVLGKVGQKQFAGQHYEGVYH